MDKLQQLYQSLLQPIGNNVMNAAGQLQQGAQNVNSYIGGQLQSPSGQQIGRGFANVAMGGMTGELNPYSAPVHIEDAREGMAALNAIKKSSGDLQAMMSPAYDQAVKTIQLLGNHYLGAEYMKNPLEKVMQALEERIKFDHGIR